MHRWGIDRRLARTVAWSASMSTATYGIEAILEGQQWIIDSFQMLTTQIARDVGGTFRSAKQQDAIREAATPPTRAALDRRTQRHFIRMVTNSIHHPCRDYIEGWDQLDNDAMEMDNWLGRVSEGLGNRGDKVERTAPLPLIFAPWIENPPATSDPNKALKIVHLYTDGLYMQTSGYGWTLEDEAGHELQHGDGSLGKFQTAYDGGVAAIENGLKSVVQSQVDFEHITVYSDSTSAILQAQHNRCESRATKIIRHVQKLKSRDKSALIQWIKGHNNHLGKEWADHLAGKAAEEIEPQLRGQSNEKSISLFKERISKYFTASSITDIQSHGN
jgi:ribonuclease HI